MHYDLVFLLDASSSVGKEGFEKVRQWVANLVDTFEVGPDRTRVGVVRYSDQPATAFELGRFGSRAEVKAAARQLAYQGGHTHTGDALRYITRHSFTPRAGGRPGDRAFKQVAILLTDGRSQDLVLPAALAAHRAGIRIFAVGVGEALREELEEIASEPKAAHVFHVSDFDAIDKIRGKLRRRLCESEWGPRAGAGAPGAERSGGAGPGHRRRQPRGTGGPEPPEKAASPHPARACRQGPAGRAPPAAVAGVKPRWPPLSPAHCEVRGALASWVPRGETSAGCPDLASEQARAEAWPEPLRAELGRAVPAPSALGRGCSENSRRNRGPDRLQELSPRSRVSCSKAVGRCWSQRPRAVDLVPSEIL